MRHAGIQRKRSRAAGANVLALVVMGCALLVAPSGARADFDITNDWVVSLNLLPGPTSATCTWGFQQTGGTFVAYGNCGSQVVGGLQGTIDVVSGAVAGGGSIVNILFGGPLVEFSFTGSVAPSGASISATVSGSVTGSLTATLCRNGNLDPGEACDEGFAQGSCCTSTCTLQPDGTSCTTTEECQIAPTCSAGACVGSPRLAGTPCEADDNSCTTDGCDGAGSCAVGSCSPCCGGPSCTPQPRFGACQRQTNASLIDIQSTPFGAKDKIVWNVPHVEATSIDDLPDPETTPYAVCFYTLDSEDEFHFLSYDVVAPTAQSCGRPRCWKQGPKGVTYNGGSLKPGGVASLRVGTGVDGKAKLSFVGKGPELGLDRWPFGLLIFGGELLVELHAGDSCWSTQYFNPGNKPAIRTNTRYRMRGGQ